MHIETGLPLQGELKTPQKQLSKEVLQSVSGFNVRDFPVPVQSSATAVQECTEIWFFTTNTNVDSGCMSVKILSQGFLFFLTVRRELIGLA